MKIKDLAQADLKSLTYEQALEFYLSRREWLRKETEEVTTRFGQQHVLTHIILPELEKRRLTAIRRIAAGRERGPTLRFRVTGRISGDFTMSAIRRLFDFGTPAVTHITPLLRAQVAAGRTTVELRDHKFVLTTPVTKLNLPV